MAKSAETLQAVLNNCDCKLDIILTQLESIALKATNSLDESTIQDIPNPIQLVSQIKTIRERLVLAKEKFSELEEIRHEIHEQINKELETLKNQASSIIK